MKEIVLPISLVLTIGSLVWGASSVKSQVDLNTSMINQLVEVTQNLAAASQDQRISIRELQVQIEDGRAR